MRMNGDDNVGVGDKLKFWKKSEELGLKDELGIPGGNLPAENPGFGGRISGMPPSQPLPVQPDGMQMPNRDPYAESQPYAPQQPPYPNRDMELVSAKLDALKATLENINQRLAGLERVAYGEDEKRSRKEW